MSITARYFNEQRQPIAGRCRRVIDRNVIKLCLCKMIRNQQQNRTGSKIHLLFLGETFPYRFAEVRDGSQFRVFDPFGNMLVFFNKQYAPPLYLEAQNHTEEILNQVWVLRDIYANDKAAARTLDRALEGIKNQTGIEYARLLAARSEIAIAMGELDLSSKLEDMISQIYLPDSELRKYDEELRAPRQLRDWAGIDSGL
ncbi:hypothetical protein [Paenibacillus sp. PAMC21692]|uniref:hypothetical protein n=1 Tax=Paenibacillus sp. PAMC21692 TaxID=2762320 RepID=UPI00164DB6A6|nr:hypothetical protein [Paenibacillus sp. PAMC21692]QNK54966.1 hypothetical protein H7F31_20260 [Paenibacillus sp. PAMC21692]